MPPAESPKADLTAALKHCDDRTVAAALRLREFPTPADLDLVIRGVLSRALPEEKVASLPEATGASRLVEDIGMDSFGMIEVVMTAEEVLGITISNEEMKSLATLGELTAFLQGKLADRSSPAA